VTMVSYLNLLIELRIFINLFLRTTAPVTASVATIARAIGGINHDIGNRFNQQLFCFFHFFRFLNH